jgi:tripartite-type tricarboxylate transporter receptor subunit TctC
MQLPYQLIALDDGLWNEWHGPNDDHYRRRILSLAAGAAALPTISRIAWAQAYPTRPVRIIVGNPPGGGTDIVARLMGKSLSERLGQQVIIENRPGAGSNIGAEAVVRAAPCRPTRSSAFPGPPGPTDAASNLG